MLKKTFSVVTTAVMLLILFGLASCAKSKPKVYEDGYFQYIVIEENVEVPYKNIIRKAVIVGFTKTGMELEVIDIPKKIDGMPVVMIGYQDSGFYHNNNIHVYSEKLRKIYVHENIKNIVNFDGSKVDMMVCTERFDIIFGNEAPIKKIYIYNTLYEKTVYPRFFSSANVVFSYNMMTQDFDYYRLDNIDPGDKIPEPPNPERTGYQFGGWYSEPECINQWDFNVSPIINDNTELILYAKWL